MMFHIITIIMDKHSIKTEHTMTEKENYIRKLWTDPRHPGSFASPEKVYKIIRKEGKYKIGKGSIKKCYPNLKLTMFKNLPKKF